MHLFNRITDDYFMQIQPAYFPFDMNLWMNTSSICMINEGFFPFFQLFLNFHHFIDGARCFISHILRDFCACIIRIIRFLRICEFFTVIFAIFLLYFTFFHNSLHFTTISSYLCNFLHTPIHSYVFLRISAFPCEFFHFFFVFCLLHAFFYQLNFEFFFNPSIYLNSFLLTKFKRF